MKTIQKILQIHKKKKVHKQTQMWLQPGQRQKQNLNRGKLLGRQQLSQYIKEDGLTLSHPSKISIRTISRRKLSIFFDTIKRYIEKGIEQLNFSKSSFIFEIIILKYRIGPMIDGKLVWLQAEDPNEDISIALIIWEQFIYLRALQGHSGSNLIDPTLQDNVLIGPGIFPYIYHVGCTFIFSIISNGLVLGGQNLSRRQTVFFLPVDPRDESHRDREYIDFSVPRLARYMHKAWKRHQDAVFWVDIDLGIKEGLGLATKSCPLVPPPQLRLSRVSRALHAASVGSQPSADASGTSAPSAPVSWSLRPTPTTNGTLSSMHTASPHLLVASRPPSPSRPKPLELVGVLATSVVVVSAKPPSAPLGGTFDLFPLLFCALLPGAASLVGSLWARAHSRGSCGSGGPRGLLLRLLSSARAFSSVVGAGSGVANSSASLKTWRSPACATLLPGNGSARQSSSWWSSSLAKRLHRCRICCSWTSLPCSRVWRLQVVS